MSRLVNGFRSSKASFTEWFALCEKHVLARGLRISFLAFAALVIASGAMAQHSSEPSSEPNDAQGENEPPFETFGGYSYLREDGHNLNGWTGTFILNVNHWFAVAADFDGHYGSHQEESEDVYLRAHGFTFGPHVSFHNHSRVTPFAFALFGGAHESVKVAALTESATGFAANLGGGLDMHFSDSLSVRLIQVDAAYTRFERRGTTSPRYSAGLVFHFGKPR